MSVALPEVLKTTTGQILLAMAGVLRKAAAHAAERNIPEENILGARLAPDMFNMARQVQIATDMAARGAARLAGSEFLSLPDTETSFEQLIERVMKAHAFIQAASNEAIEANDQQVMQIPVGPETRDMTGRAYLLNFLLPNFYFHATTAYALLRHNGVSLSKRDFLVPA